MAKAFLGSLFSGSSGNSSLACYGDTKVLIDCGVSGKRITEAIRMFDFNPAELSAILVTHEHIDHIRAVGILSRKFHLPVYATKGTWKGMKSQVGQIDEDCIRFIEPGELFPVKDVEVQAFSIPHDANNPVGFNLFCGNEKITVATDIGIMEKELFDQLQGSTSIILESNHDTAMLLTGSYPPHLKMRIRGDRGHLSNGIASKVCARLAQSGTKNILLAHLSEENNRPELAFEAAKCALEDCGVALGEDICLSVARRYGPSHCSLLDETPSCESLA